ncbi:MAG TPA: hypothetical protein VLF90_00500 [Patescibacteria group bacterium]|nr:hypothetical protein [Patescibacteria group bacterium]
MALQSRRIPLASDESLTLDGVPEALEQFRVDMKHVNSEHALRYGSFVVSQLTDVLSDKIYFIELYRRNPDRWFGDYGHCGLRVPPRVKWGVVGPTLVAGTVAAELAIQHEAERVDYATQIDFPDTRPEDINSSVANVWCQLTVTNPELQAL